MSITVDRKKIFVGGEFVEGAKGEWQGVLNPATGEVIAEVPECTGEDVDEAVRAARSAFEGWFETTPAERSEMLHGLADMLEEHAEELAQAESRNVGKPIASAREESYLTSSIICASSPGLGASSKASPPASIRADTQA